MLSLLSHRKIAELQLIQSDKDTVVNVVPNADISKTHKITFFSIISKISIFASQNFVRISGCGTEQSSTKNWSFLGKMAGKDRKIEK